MLTGEENPLLPVVDRESETVVPWVTLRPGEARLSTKLGLEGEGAPVPGVVELPQPAIAQSAPRITRENKDRLRPASRWSN
jgi:hypothetical protein